MCVIRESGPSISYPEVRHGGVTLSGEAAVAPTLHRRIQLAVHAHGRYSWARYTTGHGGKRKSEPIIRFILQGEQVLEQVRDTGAHYLEVLLPGHNVIVFFTLSPGHLPVYSERTSIDQHDFVCQLLEWCPEVFERAHKNNSGTWCLEVQWP